MYIHELVAPLVSSSCGISRTFHLFDSKPQNGAPCKRSLKKRLSNCSHAYIYAQRPARNRLAATVTADSAALHLLQLLLELLDLSVSLLEILVETVALGDELLFPLSETLLLDLDLLGEALSESFLLLLELGVVELSGTGLAEFAGLHLLGTVGLVVQLLGGVDEVEHVCSDQDGAELLEIAVVLVLNLSNTPRVLATLDNTTITSLDILLGTNDSEGHGVHKAAGVLGSGLIVLLDRGLVNLDVLGLNDRDDLDEISTRPTSSSSYYLLSA